GRKLPERARPPALPLPSAPGRVPALPRSEEPGQGRPPGDLGCKGDRPTAEARGEEAGSQGAALLPRVRRAPPRRTDRIPRRGNARREGRAAPERALDAVSDRVGGALRP